MYLSCRYVQSWIEKREVQSEKANMTILFERYVPILIDTNRSGRFKKITPIQEVCTCTYIQMTGRVTKEWKSGAALL